MSIERSIPDGETGFDRTLGFTISGANARGRIVRIGPVLEDILSAHDYPPAIKHLLAEALVLTAMMGSLLKEEGSQLTVQAQAEGGIVSLLVCDYLDGKVRGYVQHDPSRIGDVGSSPTLETLFGEGYLAITFDLAATGERYQGLVGLEGASLSHAFQAYFERSEQVPTLLRVGIRVTGREAVAGGLLIQHFPEGEEGRERLHIRSEEPDLDWERVEVLASSARYEELVDASLSLEQIVWRLYHEEPEVRVEPLAALGKGCRCSAEHYREILMRFEESERSTMRDEGGKIPVDCAFCSKIFRIAA